MAPTPPTSRKKVLLVCAQNKIRSYTAEKMLAGSPLYDVRSRGVSNVARIKLTAGDLGWADLIFVMEKNHKERIARKFSAAVTGKRIICLFIEDIYQPMEASLLAELRRKLAPHLDLPEFAEPVPNRLPTKVANDDARMPNDE